MDNLIVAIVVALITGFVTGTSAGLVVARMARFEELRNEARRIVWGIDYIYTGADPPRINERRPTTELLYISGEFYALKHRDAGEAVSRLFQEIGTTLSSLPRNVEAMNERYSGWKRTCRELKPERKVIFSIP
jgi:hypothetical protein